MELWIAGSLISIAGGWLNPSSAAIGSKEGVSCAYAFRDMEGGVLGANGSFTTLLLGSDPSA